MEIILQLTHEPLPEKILPPAALGPVGAWLEFRGLVRGEEQGQPIAGLVYEAYPEMAVREMRRLLEEISARHPCHSATVIHRLGLVPAGEAAIYIGVAGKHRAEALALLGEFMDWLKQDVPIWKRRAAPFVPPVPATAATSWPPISLETAIETICNRIQPRPAVSMPLALALGRVLRETVCAREEMPLTDSATRDGYAIRQDDPAETFCVVDTLHAADWKPRTLQPGEAVRVATGTALPCPGLRVLMQEHVTRSGEIIRLRQRDPARYVRVRGEDARVGDPLVSAGTLLTAGPLALLASAGCTEPKASPVLHVMHFTTGDEIIPPGGTLRPGQVRDSNSTLIRGLLEPWGVQLTQTHLPENFEAAWTQLDLVRLAQADMVLVSGGARVGEKDFTRPLLERLGFTLVFNQLNLRPGKPLVFGVDGARVAFGLPGNPLSHFVCFHLAVATALARLIERTVPSFRRGLLANALTGVACPRETLWPAQLLWTENTPRLHPLPWHSSGDVTCFAAANALLRIPAHSADFAAGAEVEFLPLPPALLS